jgi:putative ABC transport system substrate-binding protein
MECRIPPRGRAASVANVALAAKAATSTIPIVFSVGGDALENGLVKNFNKPEANVTGMTTTTRQLAPKYLDYLRALMPEAKLFGYLDNIATTSEISTQYLIASACSVGVEVVTFHAGTPQEIDSAFEAMVQQRVHAVIVSTDAYLGTRYDQIVSLAKLHALPTISPGIAERGGLMSYRFETIELYRRAGVYVGRLLRGAKVADLPVEMPTRTRLIINLKTAKALGPTIPPNQVIE